MFARSVSLHLKPNRVDEFTRIIENEVIPMMRSLKGFQDKIVLVAAGGLEAIGLSIWDQKEDAEAYGRGTYRKVVKALAKVIEGIPRVETREVSNSTFHKIAARIAA
jgi:heme-degrading monooxygenase HmoA